MPRLTAALANWLAFAAAMAAAFALTPYLLRTLGPERYGVWCVVESLLAYVTVFDMGVGAWFVRSVARAHATRDADGMNRAVSNAAAFFTAAGIVAAAFAAPVLVLLAPRLERQAGNPGDVLPFALVMLANLAASLPLSVIPNLLDGLEKYAAKSAVRVLVLAGRTTATVAAAPHGLQPLAGVFLGFFLLEHLLLAALCRRFLPDLRPRRNLVTAATLREVRRGSTDAFLAMVAGRVTLHAGAVVVGLVLPGGQVAAFVTAVRLVEYAKTLLRTVTATLTPGVASLDARGDTAAIRKLVLTATRWLLYVAVPVNLGLWAVGRPFLLRWVPTVADAATLPLMLLAGTVAVGVAQSVASRVLYGLGRLRTFARLAVAEGVLNLILTAALVGPFGLAGAAAAVAVPNFLFCIAVVALAVRELGIPWADYRAAAARPLAAGILPAVVWLTLDPAEPTWPAVTFTAMAGLVPYSLAVLALEAGPFARRAGSVRDRNAPRVGAYFGR